MAVWDSLIRFLATDGREYWASFPLERTPVCGLTVQGYSSIANLESGSEGVEATVEKARLN
jgi:hypothetical protein